MNIMGIIAIVFFILQQMCALGLAKNKKDNNVKFINIILTIGMIFSPIIGGLFLNV